MELSLINLASCGAIAAVVAVIAWYGDHRRKTRNDPDAVGFVDWTTLFFLALLVACLTLGGAARMWFAS